MDGAQVAGGMEAQQAGALKGGLDVRFSLPYISKLCPAL